MIDKGMYARAIERFHAAVKDRTDNDAQVALDIVRNIDINVSIDTKVRMLTWLADILESRA